MDPPPTYESAIVEKIQPASSSLSSQSKGRQSVFRSWWNATRDSVRSSLSFSNTRITGLRLSESSRDRKDADKGYSDWDYGTIIEEPIASSQAPSQSRKKYDGNERSLSSSPSATQEPKAAPAFIGEPLVLPTRSSRSFAQLQTSSTATPRHSRVPQPAESQAKRCLPSNRGCTNQHQINRDRVTHIVKHCRQVLATTCSPKSNNAIDAYVSGEAYFLPDPDIATWKVFPSFPQPCVFGDLLQSITAPNLFSLGTTFAVAKGDRIKLLALVPGTIYPFHASISMLFVRSPYSSAAFIPDLASHVHVFSSLSTRDSIRYLVGLVANATAACAKATRGTSTAVARGVLNGAKRAPWIGRAMKERSTSNAR
ncbi:MAG: hypothetical protein M1827_001978 [Pycnora praestabilis]|nr:MAG: hypothetical protein M1827_001978 [Pycnora praestabilis]